jgi:hypothetical protein
VYIPMSGTLSSKVRLVEEGIQSTNPDLGLRRGGDISTRLHNSRQTRRL